MMSESLLRTGHAGVAADYLRWYAPHQFANGKVPCCVDERGADPVPEHDSPGELIFLAAEVYRYTGDRRLLEAMWPRVEAAARYLESLRQSERTDANLRSTDRAFYGLLPASISHEGYSAKPMHSYWDDFWGAEGVRRRDRGRRRRSAATTTHAGWRPSATSSGSISPRRSSTSSRRTASRTFPARPSSAISIRRPRRSPSPPAASCTACPPIWCSARSSGTGASSSTGATAGEPGKTTRPTSSATSARSCAWAGATGRTSCSTSSWPVVVRRRGTSGPR